MSDTAFALSGDDASSLIRPRALDTILYGGLAVGVLDITAALVSAGLAGTGPVRVLQFIASGLLGRAAFDGGWATALLGLGLHFLIAFGVATVYYGASLVLPTLLRRAVLWGLVYGVVVYFVMKYVVVALSATRPMPFSVRGLLTGVIIHALFVGLPVALVARRSARAHGRG